MKMKIGEKFDTVGHIMEYEGGTLSDRGTLELFSHLIETGQAWTLQGSYGRAAKAMIDGGWIDKQGKVDWEKFDNAVAEQDE